MAVPIASVSMQTVLGEINTILFDKDGTLLDFHATWDHVLGAALREATGGDGQQLAGAANAVGFDLATGTILANAPFVAESNHKLGKRLRPFVDLDGFNQAMRHFAKETAVPMLGMTGLLQQLSAAAIRLAVVTNDSEAQARRQLHQLGWVDYFDVVVGYDSGYGAKPDAGPVLGALALLGSDPVTSLMVGDTMHDLRSGLGAGVLTAYIGEEPELASLADVAGPSIVTLFESILALG